MIAAADEFRRLLRQVLFQLSLWRLESRRPKKRERAAVRLGDLGDPAAVAPLVGALSSDRDECVRVASAAALGQLRNARAVDSLITALKDPDSMVGEAAAIALGNIGEPRAVEPLTTALRERDWRVRRGALTALASVRDDRAIEALAGALSDHDSLVRKLAASFLVLLGWHPRTERERALLDSAREPDSGGTDQSQPDEPHYTWDCPECTGSEKYYHGHHRGY